MPPSPEPIVPFRVQPELLPVAGSLRSTWLYASLDALRERELYGRYLARLPPAQREAVVSSVAGMWLPMDVAVAHYRAIDELALTTAEQLALGRVVFKRLEKTILSLAIRAAREAGVTPWSTLRMVPAIFEREVRGGGCALFKLGPKDAQIEVVGFPCAGFDYCRTALRSLAAGLCELVCQKAYVHDVKERCSDTTLTYRVAWA